MSKYTFVDEAYDVILMNSMVEVVRMAQDLFLEDGKPADHKNIAAYWKENPKSNMYLYKRDPDEEHLWCREWYYKVARH